MIGEIMKDLVGKNIVVYGMSGRKYEGRLMESEDMDFILEQKDGFVHLSLPCCEAITWGQTKYPEPKGGWPRNYTKKPESADRPNPEPDERHFSITIPVDVGIIGNVPEIETQIKAEILKGLYPSRPPHK
jgi:hypothetical protein